MKTVLYIDVEDFGSAIGTLLFDPDCDLVAIVNRNLIDDPNKYQPLKDGLIELAALANAGKLEANGIPWERWLSPDELNLLRNGYVPTVLSN